MKSDLMVKLNLLLKKISGTASSKNILPEIYREAEVVLQELQMHEKKMVIFFDKLIKMADQGKLNDTKQVSNLFFDAHLLCSSQENYYLRLSNFFTHISLSIEYPFLLAPNVEKQHVGLISHGKKFDHSIKFVISLKNTIIINCGSYGIQILSKKLEVQKVIYLFRGIIFDKVLTKISEDEILIVDYDNSIFVHVNLNDESYSVIQCPDMPSITPLYWWQNDEVIFCSGDNTLFSLDLKDSTLKEITYSYKKKHYSNFYNFIDYTCTYEKITWADPFEFTFAFLDRTKQEGGVVNLIQDTRFIVPIPSEDIFNVIYSPYYLFLVGEEDIEFYSLSIDSKGSLHWLNPYLFSGLTIIHTTLIVASNENVLVDPTSFLTAYELV